MFVHRLLIGQMPKSAIVAERGEGTMHDRGKPRSTFWSRAGVHEELGEGDHG